MAQKNDVEQLKEAVQNDPQDAEAWKALATVLAEQGQRQQALQAYRHSLTLAGTPGQVLSIMDFLGDVSVAQEERERTGTPFHSVGLLSGVSLPLWFQVFLGLFSFLMMLLLAVAQQWAPVDLVWSLWISSLVLGYSFILTSILAMFLGGQEQSLLTSALSKLGEHYPKAAWLLGIPGALFMLVFFSFHFLFFHFIHSVFLNMFFPLLRPEALDTIGLQYFVGLIATCIRRYWPFIFMSAIAQVGSYIRAFQQVNSSQLFMPYQNVLKMHVSIFVFAFLEIGGVRGLALYYVLFFYFFPWRGLWEFLKGARKKTEALPSA